MFKWFRRKKKIYFFMEQMEKYTNAAIKDKNKESKKFKTTKVTVRKKRFKKDIYDNKNYSLGELSINFLKELSELELKEIRKETERR